MHLVCPGAPWDIPGLQLVQLDSPELMAYIPVPHTEQLDEPVRAYFPSSQLAQVDALSELNVPAAHAEHATAPKLEA
jgi:hypothetical protein